MSFRIKKRSKGESNPLEINVTPMIDMFSVLVSFLLVTAVFSSVGQHTVQIPFLSSAPPPSQAVVDKDPKKVLTLIIDNQKAKLEVTMSNVSKIVESAEFNIDPNGLDSLQAKIYSIKSADPKVDTVTIMQDTQTEYEKFISVLDALRELKANRPPLPVIPDPKADPKDVPVDGSILIPKIILGNVIL